MAAPYSILDRFIVSATGGQTLPSASVYITTAAGAAAILYANRAGSATVDYPSGLVDNPLFADENGRIKPYCEPGRYNIVATSAEGTVYYYDVMVAPEDPLRLGDIDGDFAVVATFDDLATATLVMGEMIATTCHTSGTAGSLQYKGVPTAGLTPDGGTISYSGTAGVFAQAVGYSFISIENFGGIAGADCTAAIALCEASEFNEFYLPAGIYASSASYVTKTYYGDGNLVLAGAKKAKRQRIVTSNPASVYGTSSLFAGDQSNIQTDYFAIAQALPIYYFSGPDGFTDAGSNPTYKTNAYFNTELSPHLYLFEIFSGYSGMSTKIVGTCLSGQKNVTVRDTDTLAPGMRLVITGGSEELVTVDTVVNSGLFTTVLNLAATHNANETVRKGSRTHFEGVRSDLSGVDTGGDHYSFTGRISLSTNDTDNPDQTHFAYRATAGLLDGDATAASPGVYLQCSEFRILDSNYLGSHDIAAIGDVRSYSRTNSTGAYGNVWIGNLQKSEGTEYCEAAYSVLGKWKGGLDLILADFGTDKAAIKLAPDQRIFFDGSPALADEAGYTLWGENPGDTYMTYSSGLAQLLSVVNGTTVLSLEAGNAYVTGILNTTSAVKCGSHMSMPSNRNFYLNGYGSTTYITFNGTHVYLITNGGAPKQLD